MNGKLAYTAKRPALPAIYFGNDFISGMYIVSVTKDRDIKTIKC